ncbi:hypothetical protein EBZ80_13285 [bacterium]|nr:hypothetical protein [bacterium]
MKDMDNYANGVVDVCTRFQSLPVDIQRVVARFLPLWQRRGLRRPPGMPGKQRYYTTVRKCPPGARFVDTWLRCFTFRRQTHFFQWEVRVAGMSERGDEWIIKMQPQWNLEDATHHRAVLQHICHRLSWTTVEAQLFFEQARSVDLHHVWFNREELFLQFELAVERHDIDAPPTRQHCAEDLMRYVRRLDQVMHEEAMAYRNGRRRSSK